MLKQVIVVNTSLEMPVGKLAAQVSHAAVMGYGNAADESREVWIHQGKPTIILAGIDTGALLDLLERATAAGLPASLVEDSGLTLLAAGTVTCLGIGPAAVADIDQLTGKLRLL
jgi:peptidyl-tRNA hydrolase, PTH2 family